MSSPAPVTPALIDRLRERLGSDYVLTDAQDIAGHIVKSRGLYKGATNAVVRPKDTAEVSFVMGECAREGVSVVPHGGNTGLVGGGVPFGGIVLSLSRLNSIREIDPVNSTLTAEAGCTLADPCRMRRRRRAAVPAVARRRKAPARSAATSRPMPAERPCCATATPATSSSGSKWCCRTGEIWSGLRGLRKDNAGYDLKQLFIGSEGTLGIVTAAVLKLYPAPKSTVTAFIACSGPHDALKIFERLREAAGDQLTAFEFIPRFGLEMVMKHGHDVVRPLAGDHPAYALIELTSPQGDADLQTVAETVLGQAIEDELVEDATIAASGAQIAGMWKLRELMSEVQGKEGGSIKHDVSVPVSRVADFIEEASRQCEEAMPGIRVCAFGHFGDGNIHFNLSQPVEMSKGDFLAQWERFNRIVHDVVSRMHGSIAAEHGVGLIKRDELLLYKDPVAVDLMRTVKRALDPANILNPGKVVAIDDAAPPALPGTG